MPRRRGGGQEAERRANEPRTRSARRSPSPSARHVNARIIRVPPPLANSPRRGYPLRLPCTASPATTGASMRLRGTGWFFACCALLSTAAAAQAPLPAGWPARMELGMADSPGGAAAMRATAPFLFRYQYLAGGVNTGSGGATWKPNRDFVRVFIQDSAANGLIPVFTYYQLLQSRPGGGGESDAVFANLNNTATMTAYYNDLTLFFQKAGAFPGQRVMLHVEPDFWGHMQQRSLGDAATTVPPRVWDTGPAAPQGLPGNVPGFRQAVRQLP